MLAEGVKIYLLWKLTQYLIFLGLHLCFSKCWEQYKKGQRKKMFFFLTGCIKFVKQKITAAEKKINGSSCGLMDLTGALYRGT